VPAQPFRGWAGAVRLQDLIWPILFAALIVTESKPDASLIALLTALAALQVLESKLAALATTRGRVVWNLLKLLLGYLLTGYTGGIDSRYWLIQALPMISVATTLGVGGTLVFTLLAEGSYVSFLLFVDARAQIVDIDELVTRAAFLAMMGILANGLAEQLRAQSQRHRHTAEQLAEANRHLQEAEEAVRRSDRLAALGQLSAGLAHELRNPLGTIRASSEMLGRNLSTENELAREMAGFIKSEVDRVNSLITRFLQFARPLALQLETADLAQTLDRAIAAAEREAPGIAFYRNYAPELAPFSFDAELLERVFFNLVLNAAQASEAGGAVTVKTRASGTMAEVAIIDRGSGIAPQQLSSIFNPFFTTKAQGVGLGLAIVARIVDEHGGKIAVESEPGKGSIFRVLLPLEPTAAPSAAPDAS
jgi:two-component system, NtrC family, sensor histidine kinase HydH